MVLICHDNDSDLFLSPFLNLIPIFAWLIDVCCCLEHSYVGLHDVKETVLSQDASKMPTFFVLHPTLQQSEPPLLLEHIEGHRVVLIAFLLG